MSLIKSRVTFILVLMKICAWIQIIQALSKIFRSIFMMVITNKIIYIFITILVYMNLGIKIVQPSRKLATLVLLSNLSFTKVEQTNRPSCNRTAILLSYNYVTLQRSNPVFLHIIKECLILKKDFTLRILLLKKTSSIKVWNKKICFQFSC